MPTEDVSAAPDADHASVERQRMGEQPEKHEDQKREASEHSEQQRQQHPMEGLGEEVHPATSPGKEESHPLISAKKDSGAKLHIEPPEKIEIKRNTVYHIRLIGLSWSGKTRNPLCARESFASNSKRGLYTELNDWEITRTRTNDQRNVFSLQTLYNWEGRVECRMSTQRRYTHNHIVIGIMNRWTGVPRERLVEDIAHRQFFRSIHHVSTKLRPWWIRVLSLKSIQGFAVYQCYPGHGYHSTADLDHQTELVLTELYHDYTRRNVLSELRWLPWIQQYFNQGDSEPGKPRLALQLVLRWDSTKIGLYGLTPVLLSLAIGFWFQYSQEGDRIAVVQTAWTISGFIIGTASILIAIVAAITQIGDI
ncbi:hypothetical protein GQ44DRAFT_730472 [Phaeosphaeriaceae sp. PMI808]|nr:hypothetical protein GQ44DRAFT_730472 [Phaeosphaeriaceae sp. PMI808]